MEKLLNKITKIVVYVIMALAVFFTIWTLSQGSLLEIDKELANKVLNPYFILTLITFLIAAATALFFPLGQLASNPKAAIKAGASIAILAIVYIISWSMASDSTVEPYYQTFDISATMSKFIGSLIYVVYILGAISILSIIASAALGIFSKR